ncbi:hypothetical protein AAFF_G00397090 [Aldrovandia affinis]|uniref:Uncharacterized protein n=1 Tax=Aldrovandia affinis TaxID=143900 RepID=A0AAD7SF91_9TELE|nr:hypothetical protein AAFF_G00397090 [Aldrovandia affinis]
MEPFAGLVRWDLGVDGVRLPGAADEVLKIQQYADAVCHSGGFAVCMGGLKILGVRFWARGSAAQSWEACLALVRSRLDVWSCRQLSLTGKVLVVRSVLLPLLLHLVSAGMLWDVLGIHPYLQAETDPKLLVNPNLHPCMGAQNKLGACHYTVTQIRLTDGRTYSIGSCEEQKVVPVLSSPKKQPIFRATPTWCHLHAYLTDVHSCADVAMAAGQHL